MMFYKSEQGIGLVEVMVALLLLAVAVLGFSAMQLAAVKSTDESLMRTRALAIMRGGAENMRGYADGLDDFQAALNGTPNHASITIDSCVTKDGDALNNCTVGQLATKDALILREFAATQGIQLGMDTCPGTAGGQVRRCMIASWDDTTATFGSADNDCANATTGIQNTGASCFVMEAY